MRSVVGAASSRENDEGIVWATSCPDEKSRQDAAPTEDFEAQDVAPTKNCSHRRFSAPTKQFSHNEPPPLQGRRVLLGRNKNKY